MKCSHSLMESERVATNHADVGSNPTGGFDGRNGEKKALRALVLNDLNGPNTIGIGFLCPRSLKDRHLASNQNKCRFESCRGFGDNNERL